MTNLIKAANDCVALQLDPPQKVGQKLRRPSEYNVYSASDRLKIARYAITSVTTVSSDAQERGLEGVRLDTFL